MKAIEVTIDVVGGANTLGSDKVEGSVKITVEDTVKGKAIQAIFQEAGREAYRILTQRELGKL